MSDADNKKILEIRLGYGPDQLAKVTDEILNLIQMRLVGVTPDDDKTFTAAELQNVLLALRTRQDADFQDIVNDGWRRLSKASEEAYWAKMRSNPLERLMVNNFAHLLAPYGDIPHQGLSFSRRIIPAYIASLNQILGPELLEEYKQRAHDLVRQTAEKSPNGLADWPTMVKGPAALSIVNDILVYIAQYFVDIPKRRAWMVDYFGLNMPKPTSEGEADWRFDDEACLQLIGALYYNLFRLLENEEAKELLVKRYGVYNVETLVEMHHSYMETVMQIT